MPYTAFKCLCLLGVAMRFAAAGFVMAGVILLARCTTCVLHGAAAGCCVPVLH